MLEQRYILETPLQHRKRYGQFFTPPKIANIMAKWVMKDNPKTVLDPAFGLGVFYNEMIKNGLADSVHCIGYEVDNKILGYFENSRSDSKLRVINKDYLETDTGSYDCIICNPPYMRFQKVINRHKVLLNLETKLGKRLVGYSNISSIFLVKSIEDLNKNGRLAFIMPFEFFNTGYGKEVKKKLVEKGFLKHIVIFSNEKEVFPDATTTVCILFCRKDYKPEFIKITFINNKDQINKINDIEDHFQYKLDPVYLPCTKKWTPIISSLISKPQTPENLCKISEYGIVKRGVATGANEFFSLTKSKIKKLGLDQNDIIKCITKSPLIKKPVLTESDFNKLYDDDKPVYCLDAKSFNEPSLKSYIEFGESQEFHLRYLTKNRRPWYRIEQRRPAPILFGVFNRGRLKVIRNYSDSINFTCFHGFYPNIFGISVVDKLFIYFLSDIGQSLMRMHKRSYGNNLDKFEPGDLMECPCPNQRQLDKIEQCDVDSIIQMACTDTNLAIEMSNELINGIFIA